MTRRCRTEYNVTWKRGINVVNLPDKYYKYDHGQTSGGVQDIYIPTKRGVNTFVKFLKTKKAKNIKTEKLTDCD